MGYKLCTAEKPSVAKDIARVLGADKKENGYYIGNGYIVTWAVGHLVGLAEPEAYGYVKQAEMYVDDESKAQAYSELPLFPPKFKLIVLEPTKAQFEIIKSLMHREDVDEIIDCGDMGPEGHILQWFIREMAGNTKPVKRFCATSMTNEAIIEAMDKLRDASEFLPIIKGEFCKKKEDWIFGMSLSRALSIKYNAGINVGRVQSPTLGFVVKRYLEVINFKPIDFFTLKTELSYQGQRFEVYWNKDIDGILSKAEKNEEGRLLSKDFAETLKTKITELGEGIISYIKTVKKKTERPQLYDITELQRDANRKYGYSAALTLATAQALYETHKILSYPRTDSRYITNDLVPYFEEQVKALGSFERYKSTVQQLLKDGLNIDKRIVDDDKVSDHHALILTSNIKGFSFDELTPTNDERKKGVTPESLKNILELVVDRLVISVSAPYKYEQTDVAVEFACGVRMSASGKKPISEGWKGTLKQFGDEIESDCTHGEYEKEEQDFPKLQEGDIVAVESCVVRQGKTAAPKLHTEATLLTAMENAGQQIENGEILKGKGIGTQATRAEIIKKLFDTGVVENEIKGKTPYIKPTLKGLTVIRVLPKDVYSPKITADWETKIARVVDGSMTEEELLSEFKEYIISKTDEVKTLDVSVSFKSEKEVHGLCPWCGAPVYGYKTKDEASKKTVYSFYCSQKCDWALRTNDLVFSARLDRSLTLSEAKRLIAKKYITLECVSKSTGNKYKGNFSFYERSVNGKRYCNVKCELPKKKTR